MNLNLIVDQNHSYKQAIKIAYEKALREGGVDEQTAQECERVLSEPEPDYVYHEAEDEGLSQLLEDGCVSFRTLSSRDFYEHIKLNARRNAAEGLAAQMERMWQDLKKESVDTELEWPEDMSFSIDENGRLRPVFSVVKMSVDDVRQLFEMLDRQLELKALANEYTSILMGLVRYTADGLSAKYARYFAVSDPSKANRMVCD
jgi:hypothetical protein